MNPKTCRLCKLPTVVSDDEGNVICTNCGWAHLASLDVDLPLDPDMQGDNDPDDPGWRR